MFEVLYLMFTWLPSPLDVIAFGAVCILAVAAIAGVIIMIKDMIPFL